METYRGANIHIRGVHGKWSAQFSWLTARTVRIHGGSATHKQIALMKCKQTIDAELASKDVNNLFFSRKLIA